MVILDHGSAMLYIKPARRHFPDEPVAVGNLIYLKTLLIRRDLRNLLIKHAVQHHKCISIIIHLELCFSYMLYALPVMFEV